MAKKSPDSPLRSTDSSTARLLARVRAGDKGAVSSLFRRHVGALRLWARRRLPRWARRVNDTADIVQDVFLQTLRRIEVFEDRGKGALQAYLKRAVDNRINDELRKVGRRPLDDLPDTIFERPSQASSPLESAVEAENEQRYKQALATLTEEEQRLIVGCLELGYSYEQLAVICHRPSAEAARQAVRRAVLKLARRMRSADV